jgi:hypothetical protein
MQTPSPRRFLTTQLGPPLVWAVHLVVCYATVSLDCAYGTEVAGWTIAIATVAALGLLGYIALTAWGDWRRARQSQGGMSLTSFLALHSLLLCGLSALTLAWVALPAMLLPACAT